jgi:hypothetical protein
MISITRKKTITQVEDLETTPGEKGGRDMEKQDSINVENQSL